MRRQRGVALITAMLVMALITTLTFSLEWDNSMDLRRTYVSMYRDEAIQAAFGAESWVLTILRQDAQDSTTDHLGEIWASELPVLPLGGPGDSIQGEIYGEIQDLQGRFNINNLVDANGEIDEPSLEQFRRLLAALGLDPRFAGLTADWIDADQEPSFPDGAEDSTYTGIVPPYRAANQIIASTSELAAIEGMDKATLDVLLPHVIALPGRTAINVNTATGPVLQSLDENLSLADVEGLLSQRQDTGFSDVAATFSPLVAPDVLNQLAETSDYFRLRVVVRVDTVRVTLFSLIERSPQGDTTPILRSLGTT
ncbi:MAG: type II secretion system minor pseudopilin GspK [Woeseiaceae bacterium]|nr:type II secretion system minor pseudopilin GspK [Woeseiaceae bacterium]